MEKKQWPTSAQITETLDQIKSRLVGAVKIYNEQGYNVQWAYVSYDDIKHLGAAWDSLFTQMQIRIPNTISGGTQRIRLLADIGVKPGFISVCQFQKRRIRTKSPLKTK